MHYFFQWVFLLLLHYFFLVNYQCLIAQYTYLLIQNSVPKYFHNVKLVAFFLSFVLIINTSSFKVFKSFGLGKQPLYWMVHIMRRTAEQLSIEVCSMYFCTILRGNATGEPKSRLGGGCCCFTCVQEDIVAGVPSQPILLPSEKNFRFLKGCQVMRPG